MQAVLQQDETLHGFRPLTLLPIQIAVLGNIPTGCHALRNPVLLQIAIILLFQS